MKKKTLATLGELSMELSINKSKLLYYASLGLISPIEKFGKTMVFDKDKTLKKIKLISKLQESGKKLEEIKIKLGKK